MEISEEVRRAYKIARNNEALSRAGNYSGVGPEWIFTLADFARDALAEAMCWQHSANSFCMFTYKKWHPGETSRMCEHANWQKSDWQAQADKELRGEK